jgi:sugar phosphate isomerase/epimerase
MAKDVPGTLRRVREFGFTEVEGGAPKDMTAAQFKTLLDQAGLRCTSTGGSYESLQQGTEKAIADAKTLGAEYFMVAWIPHKGELTAAQAQQAAKDFNSWGKAMHDSGIHFCYHIHGYEFLPGASGTLFDDIAANTEKGIADFEMDVFWVVRPGQNPVALLEKYPGRFPLMHLKDMRKGTATDVQTGAAPDDTNVVIGTGQLDFPAILKAAKTSGVRRYYIEDESLEAADHLPATLTYLEKLKL